jgi:hypothetical protein
MDEMHNLCLMDTSKRTSNASFSMRILNSCMEISLYGRMALVNASACLRALILLGGLTFCFAFMIRQDSCRCWWEIVIEQMPQLLAKCPQLERLRELFMGIPRSPSEHSSHKRHR